MRYPRPLGLRAEQQARVHKQCLVIILLIIHYLIKVDDEILIINSNATILTMSNRVSCFDINMYGFLPNPILREDSVGGTGLKSRSLR